MKNNIHTRLGAGITALALTCTLGLNGCSASNSKFSYSVNEKGEIIVEEGSYIEYDYLNQYYVIEVYNSITNKNEIYIAHKRNGYQKYIGRYAEYKNIFNGYTIISDNNNYNPNNGLEFIKETPLLGYINSYYTLKARYTYEDMQEIYNIVKENYELENQNSMSRKLKIKNRL